MSWTLLLATARRPTPHTPSCPQTWPPWGQQPAQAPAQAWPVLWAGGAPAGTGLRPHSSWGEADPSPEPRAADNRLPRLLSLGNAYPPFQTHSPARLTHLAQAPRACAPSPRSGPRTGGVCVSAQHIPLPTANFLRSRLVSGGCTCRAARDRGRLSSKQLTLRLSLHLNTKTPLAPKCERGPDPRATAGHGGRRWGQPQSRQHVSTSDPGSRDGDSHAASEAAGTRCHQKEVLRQAGRGVARSGLTSQQCLPGLSPGIGEEAGLVRREEAVPSGPARCPQCRASLRGQWAVPGTACCP